MTLLEAIILGVIQGATEFLPISSSGHLVLVPELFGMTNPTLALVSIVHQGTLVAVLIYFRQDLWAIGRGVLAGLWQKRPLATPESRLGWFILLGSIPAAVAGLLLEDFFERVFGAPPVAALFLLVTAALLVAGERMLSGDKLIKEISWLDALIVGLFQTLALFPGVSRSGSTITAGLIRGLDREAAARFSFLLGIPAILGAGLLSALDLAQAPDLAAQTPLLVGGFISAALSGYACIYFLLAWLKRRNLYIFVVYCVLFSLLSLAIWFLRG